MTISNFIPGKAQSQLGCRGCESEGLCGEVPSGCRYAMFVQDCVNEFIEVGHYPHPGLIGPMLNGVIGIAGGVFSEIVGPGFDQTLR